MTTLADGLSRVSMWRAPIRKDTAFRVFELGWEAPSIPTGVSVRCRLGGSTLCCLQQGDSRFLFFFCEEG